MMTKKWEKMALYSWENGDKMPYFSFPFSIFVTICPPFKFIHAE
jgi:hypothetical protein